MLCSTRCFNYKNVTRNNCQSAKEKNITICICDHQARDLLACVDTAMILSNCKIIAEGSPSELVNNIEAKSAYFGDLLALNKILMSKKITVKKK